MMKVSLMSMALSAFLIACGNHHPIVAEMDSAYWVRRNDVDVSNVIRKAIPVGTEVAKATEFMRTLANAGFSVTEYSQDGVKNSLDSDKLPYTNDAMKKNYLNRLKGGLTEYVMEYKYSSSLSPTSKVAVIYIFLKDNKVSDCQGTINVSFI
jgi:hypothetical protein